jgi:hypothetical protein
MPRAKTKTEVTTLKMTPEVRGLWGKCAAYKQRTLANMFEVMLRHYARRIGVKPDSPEPAASPILANPAPRAKRAAP